MKKIFICFAFIFILCGCSQKNNDITIEDIAKAIKSIDSITDICIVTEDNDPNGKLNKTGGYIGALYFEDKNVPKITQIVDNKTFETRAPKDICEAGTIAGGSIELYKTTNEAIKRNDYLSAFDGTALASGHKLYNNIIIRTSDEFSATQQKQLENLIIEKIK